MSIYDEKDVDKHRDLHVACACCKGAQKNLQGRTGADSSSMELWSILEKSRMSPRMVSSVSPLSSIVSLSSLSTSM